MEIHFDKGMKFVIEDPSNLWVFIYGFTVALRIRFLLLALPRNDKFEFIVHFMSDRKL